MSLTTTMTLNSIAIANSIIIKNRSRELIIKNKRGELRGKNLELIE